MRGRAGIALLIVAAALVALENYIYFSDGGSPTGVADADDGVAERAEGEGAEAGSLEPVATSEVAAWLSRQPNPPRSPFLTRAEASALGDAGRSMDLRLHGVLWGPTRRVAWIDGRPHSEHDWVGDHRIERIEPDAVWLRRGEDVVELAIQSDGSFVDEGSVGSVD